MVPNLLIDAESTSQATMPVGPELSVSPQLVGIVSGQGGGPVRMERFRTVLGRRNADIVVDDPDVSRQHAVIERYGERYLIRDLGSTNGTFVNGRRVDVEMLTPGDEIEVGDSRLSFGFEVQ